MQGRPLNEYFVHHSFKSSAETEATAMLQHLMYMLSYDVQDFFPHVKILKRYRNNFAFRVVLDGKLQYFRFRGLPFGTINTSCNHRYTVLGTGKGHPEMKIILRSAFRGS